ncbi:HNH endonuclease [Clostridium paraputrificum]|uniref:HNH endonuclease n=1 Tax=Clostridium paraputrificum TaxID=29363 RepID=UPI0018973F6B|nr:NUMOD4 motif-containing HNH endonuclease [Clostridium paraputrificum]
MEIYRVINGFERYSVSNKGNVINNITGRKISARKSSNGYMRVNLRKGNCKYEKPKTASVHRLVAEAFLMQIDGKTYVNHINGDKTDNKVENLEWCSAKENTIHSFVTGLQVNPKGKDNPLSKIVYQYSLDGELINKYYGTKEAERLTGVHS